MAFTDVIVPLFDNLDALFGKDVRHDGWGKATDGICFRFAGWLPVCLMLVPMNVVNKEFNERVKQARKRYPHLCIKPAIKVAKRFTHVCDYSYKCALVSILESMPQHAQHREDCAILLGEQFSTPCSSNQGKHCDAIATGAMLQALIGYISGHPNKAHCKALLDMGLYCPNIEDVDLDLDVDRVYDERMPVRLWDTSEKHRDEMDMRLSALAVVTSMCKKITHLGIRGWLTGNDMTRGIECIKQNCESLEVLTMGCSQLTLSCLDLLHDGLPNLRYVDMEEAPQMTAKYLNGFLKARYDLGLRRIGFDDSVVTKDTEEFVAQHLPDLVIDGEYVHGYPETDDWEL